MCGICGFWGDGSTEDLSRMESLLGHRGPDSEGSWTDQRQHIFLGHKRLSIIDLESGQQPLVDSDGELVLIFNGEIYNFKDLKSDLIKDGYHFKTNSDSEVILYSYKRWGDQFVKKLNGMWAFVIYDIKKSIFFISRDRFGEKPLFYTYQKNSFVFSSELKSLISHSQIKSKISQKSVQKYFAYGFVPAPNSIYENIFSLPAGHNLKFYINTQQSRIEKYWSYQIDVPSQVRNIEQVSEEFNHLLENSVKIRMTADVPLGVFLSGGIDSSSIAYFAKKNSLNTIKTFSISFSDPSFDESRYIKLVSNNLKTNHYDHLLLEEDAIKVANDLPGMIDQPFADSSIVATYLLCKEARKSVKVALGGDGGDELLAGYDPFKALFLAQLYNNVIPSSIHSTIKFLVNKIPTSLENFSLDFKLKKTLQGLDHPSKLWNPMWLAPLTASDLSELFFDKIDIDDIYSEAIQLWQNSDSHNIIDKTIAFYINLYLQNNILVKIDRASMLNSLEVRSPFLDINLVNFLSKLPWQYKFKFYRTKYLLKKAMLNKIPNVIINRKKKGFGVPTGHWFKKHRLQIDPGLLHKLNLSKNKIDELYSEHLSGARDNRLFLWCYYFFSNWKRQ